ncbi:MAG: thioester reductase domain-containing protein [bacterium]
MTIGYPGTATNLRSRLVTAVATVLRLPFDQIDDETPFSALGLDSLAAAELTAEIEDVLGIELPLTAVHEYPSIAALAHFLENGRPESAAPFARMRADAILPADIAPVQAHGSVMKTRDARHILLTGATGFLGAHLLRTLLDETKASVVCLVRSRGGDPLSRVHANLARYALGDERANDRITAVEGDLARPLLGLSPRAFHALAVQTDAIIHGGASVDWVQGYDALRAANVLGTRELLRLACHGAPKPLHFVSSLGVCYSTLGPRALQEGADALDGLEGLRLGYAQTKCVAESLVREAGARGLPVSIVRPALVSGDSVDGRSNVDDLLTRFIAGCIAMGAAPDLDWRVDCLPVDQVARAIARCALAHVGGVDVVHITAKQPRQWRECVLWMRLCGYELDLLPYREWSRKLAAEATSSHPLYPLRSFFLHRVAGEDGLTLPELYEESRRTQVRDDGSRERMSALDARCTTIDSSLLDRYFDHYVEEGVVPDVGARSDGGAFTSTPSIDALLPAVTRSLAERLGEESLSVESLTLTPLGGDDSIVSELTSWREGAAMGLFRGALELRSERGIHLQRVIVKVKPSDERVIEVAESVAALASPALGRAYEAFRDYIGFTRSHVRELAIYRDADPRIRRHTPAVLALSPADEATRWMLVLEELPASTLCHVDEHSAPWASTHLRAAISGAAEVHSVWYGLEPELEVQPWLAPMRDAKRMTHMSPLWDALADHACAHSPAWQDAEVARTHRRLVTDVAQWARPLSELPRTLIHNDFNPRNIAMRAGKEPVLCAFDWELSTIGVPQRDLAELLCWTLSESVAKEEVAMWLEWSRVQLSRAARVDVSPADWELGFRAALCELFVDRLAMYAMVDRFRPQRYLPRVVRTCMALQRHYPWQS